MVEEKKQTSDDDGMQIPTQIVNQNFDGDEEYFEDDKCSLLQTEIIIDLYEGQNDASMSNSLSDQGSIEANSDSHKINNSFDHSDANIEKVYHCDVTFKLIYNNKWCQQ